MGNRRYDGHTYRPQLDKEEVEWIEGKVESAECNFLLAPDLEAVRSNPHERNVRLMILDAFMTHGNVSSFDDHRMWIEFKQKFPHKIIGETREFDKFDAFKRVLVNRARARILHPSKNGEDQETRIVAEVAQEIDDSITHRDGKAEVSDPPTVLRTKENPQPDPASHIMRGEKIGKVKPRGPRDLANAGEAEFQTVCDFNQKDSRPWCSFCLKIVAIFSEKKEGGREVPLCREHMNPNADGKYLH